MVGTPPQFTIGHLSRICGCKLQTIRYYEQIGLMPPPERTAGNQRIYDARHAARLTFIRHSRELGFTLAAIRELLRLADHPERSCATVDKIARDQLVEVESRIKRLAALRAELKRMVNECQGGTVADCRIVEVLANHGHSCDVPVTT